MKNRRAICFTRYAGPASLLVCIGDLHLYYSYSTVVAYLHGGRLFCSENKWSITTGKHLNAIETDHDKRLEWNRFRAGLNYTVRELGFEV